MSINFTLKNVKFTGALKGFTEKKIKSIEKISGDIIDADIIVSEEKLNFKVEISLKTKLHSYHIESKNKILKQALRDSLNTLKLQAKKNKEKIKKETKRKSKKSIIPTFLSNDQGEKSKNPRVLISTNYSKKPLTVEEAIIFLKESKDNAFLFINSDSNKHAVVYYNKDSEISIIEEE